MDLSISHYNFSCWLSRRGFKRKYYFNCLRRIICLYLRHNFGCPIAVDCLVLAIVIFLALVIVPCSTLDAGLIDAISVGYLNTASYLPTSELGKTVVSLVLARSCLFKHEDLLFCLRTIVSHHQRLLRQNPCIKT